MTENDIMHSRLFGSKLVEIANKKSTQNLTLYNTQNKYNEI